MLAEIYPIQVLLLSVSGIVNRHQALEHRHGLCCRHARAVHLYGRVHSPESRAFSRGYDTAMLAEFYPLQALLLTVSGVVNRHQANVVLAPTWRGTRAVELPEVGAIRAVPQVGGLHHSYTRTAA